MARPPRSQSGRTSFARGRCDDRFSHLATLVIVLDEEEMEHLGSKLGCKNIPRVRKSVEKMILELGISARKALRMDPHVFYQLHDTLEADIAAKFTSRKAEDATEGQFAPNGLVSTKLRLSCAVRYFAGAAVYDLVLTHGMGRSTIYQSILGIVDVINQNDALALNADSAPFPSIAEQEDIAVGFLEKSRVGFDNVIGAIDAMLVTIDLPDKASCKEIGVGQKYFHCSRKDKYGLVLLAICDHECRFRWADVSQPGRSSDYLAFTTSELPAALEDGRNGGNSAAESVVGWRRNGTSKVCAKPGCTLVGDNAFVKTHWMAVPFPGIVESPEDDYNFFLSQLRITIERAFGILIHRWGILRRPLGCPVRKVGALTMALLRLHNFCIDNNGRNVPGSTTRDIARIHERAARKVRGRAGEVAELDRHGRPAQLLGHGHHFTDLPEGRRPVVVREDEMTPMDLMVEKVAQSGLRRPIRRN